jgi:hypothetical protein
LTGKAGATILKRMRGWPSAVARLLVLAVVSLLAVAVVCVAGAQGRAADDGVLNQTDVQDPTGDSNGGPDLSSLTVTTYADGSIQFVVHIANRGLLPAGESVQLFIDLNDDGGRDLVMSLWPSNSASYMERWDGTDWVVVRQLPEAVQTAGLFSVRLPLPVLRDSAGVPYGDQLGVLVGSWTIDPATKEQGKVADDWLPDSTRWIQHQIQVPAAPPTATEPVTTPATTTTAAPTKPAAPSRLTVTCVKHAVHASVTPGKGAKVSSVGFYADGTIEAIDSKAPFAAVLPVKGLRVPVTIRATVHLAAGKTQTLHKQIGVC